MNVAYTLADTFAGIKDKRTHLKLDRDSLNNILKIILERNSHLVGTYTAGEPDALDNLDDLYKGTEGYDQTGRFGPVKFKILGWKYETNQRYKTF